MASFAGRSLRGASRVLLQAAGSQCGRIASQAARSPKLQTSQALHQVAGLSLAKQAQRHFVASVSRTVSSCALLTSAVPLGTSGSLISAGSSSEVIEGSGGEDDGLVIEALDQLDDL